VTDLTEMTASSLYDTLCSFENLLRAYRDAARGKRSHLDVAAFDYHLEGRLLYLRRQLLTHTYRPGHYRRFTIADPKPRVISAAPFADRVVHHALCNVIEPLFERRFIGDSYASRAGKGIHQALDRCTHFARRYPYVLRCDIVQFFPSVDLAILRRILGRIVRDDDVLALCDLILAGGAHELTDQYNLVLYPGDDPDDPEAVAARPRGLPTILLSILDRSCPATRRPPRVTLPPAASRRHPHLPNRIPLSQIPAKTATASAAI